MNRRPSADRRVWSVTTAVLVVLIMALALPGALSANDATLTPDTALLNQLSARAHLTLPPFAPVTAPAEGGSALPPGERAALTERIAAIDAEHGAHFGIAVQDLRTGTTYSYNPHHRFPTASVAKLTVLTMFLMQAEEEGRELTAAERAEAEQMIRYSDNSVTDGFYSRLGFTDGFVRHAGDLGFTGTEPHPGGSWGSTMTTPADQVRLLRALYTDEGPLSPQDRAHVRGLMEGVAPEQAWGVSAAAAAGDTVGLKNGWTPRSSNGGLWNVNSVGYVSGPEHEYLVAVLSDGNPDYTSGVALLELLVTEVIAAIEAPAAPDGAHSHDTSATAR
ncbi:serine hydrolase [Nocardiopsis metallicus]|uniref:Beta-lactamase class A n=1 Tax=Nocardiopsis metallicus TaxID=179819 RepID=A0A840WFC0_9ACTN|nr:serine hydrolase [Nocardiopsis metallicus]MBB5495669.1 beta-lactamase class A [Nocardiopsis metallicus]